MAQQRYSKQRELIYKTVMGAHDHPTAEMVYTMLKPDHPELSLGTVYRNLNLLADQGKLVRMPFPVERFDGDLHPHHHLKCDRCGQVVDLCLPYDGALDAQAAQEGFTIHRHTTVFYGLCPACAKEEFG